MRWLQTILREIFGLFVDDGSFALMILAWFGLTAFGLPRLGWFPAWRGVLLFLGLAAILMGSVLHYSRQRK